jgi:nucleotide-binding universal stress UspA family protein
MKSILAATDFSRAAMVAVRRAAQLAHATGARLELMHVLPPEPSPTSWTALRSAFGFDATRARDDALSRLQRAAARGGADLAAPVALHLAEGRAHAAIADRAVAIDADLVVVGAHGEHFVLDVFVGTTAQRVLRASPVPVLVVRQAPIYRYEQVLIAADFSAASVASARSARQLFLGATFHFLHVCEPQFEGSLALAGASQTTIEDQRRRAADDALRALESFARDAGFEDGKRSVRVRHGYPPARIKEHAAELDVDVIVLGAQGKSWLEAGLLGSVSEHVAAETPCDVLLVKAPA